eukprot:766794-Hanusia_phi.AAC.6
MEFLVFGWVLCSVGGVVHRFEVASRATMANGISAEEKRGDGKTSRGEEKEDLEDGVVHVATETS